MKLGMMNACSCGVWAASKLILGAEMLLALGEGFCAITCSGGTPPIATSAKAPTFNPRLRMLISAARSL
jgi:hypothetical protein